MWHYRAWSLFEKAIFQNGPLAKSVEIANLASDKGFYTNPATSFTKRSLSISF